MDILYLVTLTLIGSGWAFIKYVLAERERFVFLIVVPLQVKSSKKLFKNTFRDIDIRWTLQKVFVNVAYIIFTEKDEGDKDYTTWSHFMILLDLLCYAIILWPVYWSIRHLERVSFYTVTSDQKDVFWAQDSDKSLLSKPGRGLNFCKLNIFV